MKFVNPTFLYFFLVLLIPIVIHLFNLKKYKTLYFSNIYFLRRINEQTKSTQKLKHLLALLMRLLAISALILAFAQPYFEQDDKKVFKNQPVYAFYLDNSFSMAAQGENGTLLHQAKEGIRSIVQNSAPGSNFILVTNELSGPQKRLISKKELLNKLDEINLSASFAQLNTVINAVQSALNLTTFKENRNVFVFSDFHQSKFNLENIQPDSNTYYYPVKIGSNANTNCFINAVWFDAPFHVVNQVNELSIQLKNSNDFEVNNLAVKITIAEFERTIYVDLPANSEIIEKIDISHNEGGFKSGKVEIDDDGLDFDDVYYFSYEVKNEIDVLLINGSDKTRFPKLVFEADPIYKVNEVSISQLTLNDLDVNNTFVLNGVNNLSSGLQSNLIGQLEMGKSLTIIPGNDVNFLQFNEFLSKLKLPNFLSYQKENNLKLIKINSESNFFKPIFSKPTNKANFPKVKNYIKTTNNSFAQFEQLISFENDAPYVLYADQVGHVLIFNGALDLNSSEFVKHSLFSSLLIRNTTFAFNSQSMAFDLSQPISFYLSKFKEKDQVVYIKNENTEWIPSISSGQHKTKISIDKSNYSIELLAGNYELITKNEKIKDLSLNYSREMSTLKVISKEEIKSNFKSKGLRVAQFSEISTEKDIYEIQLENKDSIWRILLILSFMFLIFEMLILSFWK